MVFGVKFHPELMAVESVYRCNRCRNRNKNITICVHVHYNTVVQEELQHSYTTVPTQGCRQVRQGPEHPGQRQGLHGQSAGGGLGHHTPALHEVLSSLREVTDTVGQSVMFRMDFY